ncbi:hypothetical protein VM636_20735 [Streptomyces sp. SCSIO 75703]|uniref:hypothetical protein n=1 Tax=Streptomyces sp. SCSIO 75703 TaxID=3112165 RepID=UPI0030D44D11
MSDLTARRAVYMREAIAEAQKKGSFPEPVCQALLGVLDLYDAAIDQARRDDSFLQAWAMNFRLEGFTMPNESGTRTLLPGLAAAINQLIQAFPDDEDEHLPHLRSVPGEAQQ